MITSEKKLKYEKESEQDSVKVFNIVHGEIFKILKKNKRDGVHQMLLYLALSQQILCAIWSMMGKHADKKVPIEDREKIVRDIWDNANELYEGGKVIALKHGVN